MWGQRETLASQAWTGQEFLENLDHQEFQVPQVRWDHLAKKDIREFQDPQGHQARKERLG